MRSYVKYHLHTDGSNADGYFDSATEFQAYIDLAVKEGDSAIAFSEHGNIYDWIKKKLACDKAGIKYIHGVEAYMCRTLEHKERFHIGLYAKNYEGVTELNRMLAMSTNKEDGHFYKSQRFSVEEIMGTTANIIVTTACVASMLAKIPEDEYTVRFLEWMSDNRDRCFLEVQYHTHEIQKDYNRRLLEFNKKYDIRLIAGTDTHSASDYLAKCRKICQIAKDSYYGDEDSFDVVWKSYDEIIDAFKTQDVLSEEQYLDAIENTNILADMVEGFEIDRSFKYPKLYGDEAVDVWKSGIIEKLRNKINSGEIDGKRFQEYKTRVREEFDAMASQGMESFMMFMSELADFCKLEGIPIGDCRGSVGGSEIAFITDITDVDPMVWGTVFSRFVNSKRVSLADIDIDLAPEDRVKVYEYISDRFGKNKTSLILTFLRVKTRGAIDMIAKGLGYEDLDNVKAIKSEFEKIEKEYISIVQSEVNIEELDAEHRNIDFDSHDIYLHQIRNEKAKKTLIKANDAFEMLKSKDEELFFYFNGIKGTIIAKGQHPAGMIGSPITLDDSLGIFYKKGDTKHPVSTCTMKVVDYCNYVKFDILGLKTMGILKDVYAMKGEEWERSYKIDWNDGDVWSEMLNGQVGLFQFEGDFAYGLLKKFKPKNINEISLANASLRPSGKSYRDRLINREINKNPSKEIDELLDSNGGFLVFQEDTIKFLTDICGFEGGHADNVRRCIGKKDREGLELELPMIIDGYCDTSTKSRSVAELEAREFVQIIEDSAEYQFGLNHSTGYSKLGYRCIRFRRSDLVYFITAYLNRASNNDDIKAGTSLALDNKVKINGIRFGFSKSDYSCDVESRQIYKGLSSIKDIGRATPNDLWELGRSKKYDDILDLLIDIDKNGACKKNQLDILIKLGYFSAFGSDKTLWSFVEYYGAIKDRKVFKKAKLPELAKNLPLITEIKDYCTETDKQFKLTDWETPLRKILKKLPQEKFTINSKIQFQIESLGYIEDVYDVDYDIWAVVAKETKYKNPILTLKNLASDKSINIKIRAKTIKENPVEKGAVIRVCQIADEKRWIKTSDGFKQIDETEKILKKYKEIVINS